MGLIDQIRRRRPTPRSARTVLARARLAVRRLEKGEKTEVDRRAQTRFGQQAARSSIRSSRRRRGF